MSHLSDWQSDDGDLHLHFEFDFRQWWWDEIAKEGTRIYGTEAQCQVQDDSPIDEMFPSAPARSRS